MTYEDTTYDSAGVAMSGANAETNIGRMTRYANRLSCFT